jgi:hypothetical protein
MMIPLCGSDSSEQEHVEIPRYFYQNQSILSLHNMFEDEFLVTETMKFWSRLSQRSSVITFSVLEVSLFHRGYAKAVEIIKLPGIEIGVQP